MRIMRVREIKSPVALAACGIFLVPEPLGMCLVLAAAIWWLWRKIGWTCRITLASLRERSARGLWAVLHKIRCRMNRLRCSDKLDFFDRGVPTLQIPAGLTGERMVAANVGKYEMKDARSTAHGDDPISGYVVRPASTALASSRSGVSNPSVNQS